MYSADEIIPKGRHCGGTSVAISAHLTAKRRIRAGRQAGDIGGRHSMTNLLELSCAASAIFTFAGSIFQHTQPRQAKRQKHFATPIKPGP